MADPTAYPTGTIRITIEGLPDSTQEYTIELRASLQHQASGLGGAEGHGVPTAHHPSHDDIRIRTQVLIPWAQQHGVGACAWRFFVHQPAYNGRTYFTSLSNNSVSEVVLHDNNDVARMTASFRALDNIPPTIAQQRLDLCVPAGTRRASAQAVDQVFAALLEAIILPLAFVEPLDLCRLALVDTQWAATMRNYFDATNRWDRAILENIGLATYFPTPAQAAAAVSLIKAIQRPTPALAADICAEFKQEEKMYDDMLGEDVPHEEVFVMRAGKLVGLPYTFVWRCVRDWRPLTMLTCH